MNPPHYSRCSFANNASTFIFAHLGCSQLKQLLVSDAATDDERGGTLTLAGFLGFTELEDQIVTSWELVIQKTRVLPTAIWAAVHCCGATPKKLLDPLMEYWAELPDERDDYGVSFKNWFVDRLRRSLVRGIRDDVIHYLIEQCNVHESLRWHITRLCDLIDTPEAIEFTVRSVAAFERGIAGTDKISTWSLELPDNWDASKGSSRKLSKASIERLKSLWEDPTNDSFEVTFAFRLWLTGIGAEQISILKAIPPDAPFFKNALQKRMELGDQSVVKEISTLLATEVHWFYWFQFAHHVWCDELLAMTQARLEAFKESIPTDFSCGGLYEPFEHSLLSKLLTLIPVKDAEMLLEKYWSHLGYSHAFIQTALYVGTSRCLELTASSISRCPNDIPVFEFVGNTFGCFDSDRQRYLTVQHLERLLPYLDRLDEHALGTLAQACRLMGIPQWSQKYLSSRLSEQDRKLYHPSDDHLLQDLDKFAADKHGVWRVTHWLEEFDKRDSPKSRALNIVDFWLELNPTVRGLQIAAACIQAVGTRKDLYILDQYAIEGSPDEIARIKESTRFAVYRRSLD